jgi:hypothetical protein
VRAGWSIVAFAVAAALPGLAAAAPRLEHVGLDARIAGHELTDDGLDLALELRDRCTAKVGKEPTALTCGDWSPLPAEGAARKLVYKGDLDVNGKTKSMLLRGNHAGGEVFAARARMPGADWVELAPTDGGRWRLARGAVGAWGLRGAGDWALDVQIRTAEGALPAVEGSPLPLPADAWSRFTPGWGCEALTWLSERWSAGGVRPSALAAVPADSCPDAAEAARAASCGAVEGVGHVLAQSGDLERLTELVSDGEALVGACSGALEELSRSGALAREFLVTTQDPSGLVSLASTWGPLLGEAWAAATRKAAADSTLQAARRTGEAAPLLEFLDAFPDAAEAGPVTRGLLEISAVLTLPCGQKHGCPELPAGSRIEARWTDVPGREATARLVAWSRTDGATSVADALTAWVDGTPPEEVAAAADALAGESSPSAWALTLPFSLKRISDAFDGYALELRPEGLEPVYLPLRVEANLGAFAGLSRAVRVRAGGVDRVDEPGGAPLPLASLELSRSNHVVHGRHLYAWRSWSPEAGERGPAGLVRVDLDVGGQETVLSGEVVAEARSTPEGLRLRLGPGCSLAAAIVAGKSEAGELATHPGGKHGPPPSDCRGALLTADGLVDAPAELPPRPHPDELPAPPGRALVTDEVAGTPELFVVDEASGHRVQVSRAHALVKDFLVPLTCDATIAFTSRWYVDGRLLVHHGLARCGDVLRGPLLLVDPNDGSSVVLAGSTDGLPDWLDRSWAADRGAALAADGTIVVGPEVHPGAPDVHSAWWYRPALIDLLR